MYENNDHNIYRIKEIHASGKLKCLKLGKYPMSYQDVALPWETVGVYRKGPITSKIWEINPEDVHGKVISVKKLLITCPNNILREKWNKTPKIYSISCQFH